MNRITAIIFLLCAAFWASAQDALSATKCMAEAPMRVIPLISKNTRLDMIDYYEAGLQHKSTNDFGGECYIAEVQKADTLDVSIKFQSEETVANQLFVLNPSAKYPVIGMIETVETPMPESQLKLYNSKWVELGEIFYAPPRLNDWLTKAGKKNRGMVEEALPFITASYDFDPETLTLTVTNTSWQYFALGEDAPLRPLVKDQLAYKWDGQKFKMVKK